MPTCAIISFRLGLTDGVSVVAETWQRSLSGLGFDVVTVAGEGPVDRTVAGLRLDAAGPPPYSEVEAVLADADLVVVENLCTIPMNLPAALVVGAVLRGRPAILHHHDPPWQRAHFAHVTELPPTDDAWLHVTINRRTAAEMADRGIAATTIYNGFDTSLRPGPGARSRVRAQLGIAPDELVAIHPVRAIPRKNVPTAVALCEEIGATYWLAGPAEDGYGPELERILAGARCRVIRRSLAHGPDLYAAPDLVVFPSTWEGFGNPPVEAAICGLPAVVGHYPVADELRSLGFEWFSPDEAGAVSAFLAAPDHELLERNRALVARHLSLEVLARNIGDLLERAGWMP